MISRIAWCCNEQNILIPLQLIYFKSKNFFHLPFASLEKNFCFAIQVYIILSVWIIDVNLREGRGQYTGYSEERFFSRDSSNYFLKQLPVALFRQHSRTKLPRNYWSQKYISIKGCAEVGYLKEISREIISYACFLSRSTKPAQIYRHSLGISRRSWNNF